MSGDRSHEGDARHGSLAASQARGPIREGARRVTDAREPPASVRLLVVSGTDRGARALGDDLRGRDGLRVTAAIRGERFDPSDAPPVDCVVGDHVHGDFDDAAVREWVRDRTDAVYVPLVELDDWHRAADRFNGERTHPLPDPGTDRAAVLGDSIRTVFGRRRGATAAAQRSRLQTFLWGLSDEVANAPTQDAIVERTCQRLADSDHFAGAWVCDRPPEPPIREAAGFDRDRVERLHETLETEPGDAPWSRAADERTGCVRPDVVLDHDDSDRPLTLASVPLVHRGIVYGVLNVVRDGEEGGVDLTAVVDPLTSFGGTVGHALATAEMQAQGETVQQAIEQADPAIAILDEDGVVEYVNAAFESVYGYAKSEAIGSPLARFLPEDVDAERLLTAVREGSRWREEIVKHRKEGRRFYADLSVAAVPVEGGTRTKYVAVASDITALKEREQRLQVLNRVLRHNLRNDVSVIRTGAELIADGEATSPCTVADRVVETADELVAMSEKVRKASAALDESGGGGRVVLADVLADVAERLESAFPSGTVVVDVPDDVVLETNARQLEVVFDNLIENGLEHGGDAPTVDVALAGTDASERTVRVTVSDDGPGIPDHELAVLEAGEETPLEHGSGLGLWLVESAVTSLGGALSFETDRTGTTARVDLPGVVETPGDR